MEESSIVESPSLLAFSLICRRTHISSVVLLGNHLSSVDPDILDIVAKPIQTSCSFAAVWAVQVDTLEDKSADTGWQGLLPASMEEDWDKI